MSALGDGNPHFGGAGAGAMGSASADVRVASGWVRRIENLEASRQGKLVSEVRPGVARRLKTTPSVLRHLREQRRKNVPAWFKGAIRALLIQVLQAEIRALEHEIAIARQVGLDRREDAFCAAEAQLATAREILEGAAASG